MIELPSLSDYIEYLDFLSGVPAVYLLVLTAALLVIIRDWRLSLIILTAQYALAGLLYVEILVPHLVLIKVLVGLFVTIILYLTARQVDWGRLPIDVTDDEATILQQERQIRFGPYMLPTDTPFRLFSSLMIVLVMWTFAQQSIYHLPAVPHHFNFAIFALFGLGLIMLGLNTEPLRSGLGLIMLMSGFELLYSALEQSVAMLIFLAIINLTIAIVVAYLSHSRHAIQMLVD